MKILLMSHGDFAKGLLNTVEMIAGPQKNIEVYCIYPSEDNIAYQEKVEASIKSGLDAGEEVVVFTDLFFGTPFNSAVNLMDKYSFHHFTGINVPLLLEFVTSKDTVPIEQLKDQLLNALPGSFVYVNEFLQKALEEMEENDD